MAKFWERLMMEEEEMLTWTEIQRKLWSPVLESKDATARSVSSWVHFIILGAQLVCAVFLDLLQGQNKKQSPSLSVTWCFPLPEAQGGAGQHSPSWAQLQRAETRGMHWSRLRNGRRRDPVCLGVVVGWARWNQGVQDAQKFAIPDAETQVVKMFHICQFTELSWSNKDADMLMVC